NSSIGPNPNQCTVNLTNVSNGQYLTVNLNGVADSAGRNGNVNGPQMGVLIGDTTGNGSVNAGDVSQTKGQSGQGVTAANFRQDVNANGSINAGDISLVKARSGTSLP
ncbi:MAG TPA: dockerin type I domain-containing protein, partial [Candidatus Udaeobacter sp.]|nr:dockerin type I domain-containing protein [Candidatus Udaeobacter sp.]